MAAAQRIILLIVFALLVPSSRADLVPQPEFKTAHSVAAKYYLSLPKGWKPDATWPILVTIDGSGHNFPGNCAAFAKARGDRPFIIVTPCVSSNGNDPTDEPTVLAIVKEVQQEYKGREKFFITGFSAGGHLMWQVVFHHPELLAAAASAAGNFRFRLVSEISKGDERIHLPIHGFQGDKDVFQASLNQQWSDAERLAKEHGYENLSHTIVAGGGHQPFAREVMEYFSSLVEK
jgi:predicted esterase